ncbi:MAG: Mur ligase domain-containing protein, partial [Alphaproteobacteria bacterium]
MLLGDLALKLNARLVGDANTQINSVTQDSRLAKSGVLFAALPGSNVNGLDFLAQVQAAGVSAVLMPKGLSSNQLP